jgi:O-methyltransferase
MDPDAYEHHRLPNTPAHQFKGFHIVTDQVTRDDLATIWRELERVLQANVPGDIVEFGCYGGTTSLFIRRLLNQYKLERQFHVYDSFEGLPPKSAQDMSPVGTDFQAGRLAVSKKDFLHEFKLANLRPPIVHKGWFDQLTAANVPEQIAFAFLDGDFYDSIMTSLKLVWPHMTAHGVILVDDFKREALPGVERAIHDFFQNKSIQSLRGEHSIGIIHVP